MTGAFAVGAEHGDLYLRGEYPLARAWLANAIAKAKARGFPGEDVVGRGVCFELELRVGAGAYVSGEETAPFNSIEGYRGEPRSKPPFPVQAGLFGKPTCVNDVETLVATLDIVRDGAAAYASVGTAGSPGTKLFCVSGAVRTPGVYEVPFGADAQNTFAIAVAGRGFEARISTEHDLPLDQSACVFCGNCIGVCPTGALMLMREYELRAHAARDESRQSVTDTICPSCGVGCTSSLRVKDNEIVRVTSPADNSTCA
jgi:NADH:ubiquinone oxidoreductase subunit F (NADH-binding)